MATRGKNRAAVIAAIVAVVCWQLTAEVRMLLARLGWDVPWPLWPQGSPFSVQLALRRGAVLELLGLVVALAVLFVVVLLLVRAALARAVPPRGAFFLAAWMAVVVGTTTAALVAAPIFMVVLGLPSDLWLQHMGNVTMAPFWGVVVGWVAALAAALSATPTSMSELPGNPAAAGSYLGAAGYPATSNQVATLYPNLPGGSDPSQSPYTNREER